MQSLLIIDYLFYQYRIQVRYLKTKYYILKYKKSLDNIQEQYDFIVLSLKIMINNKTKHLLSLNKIKDYLLSPIKTKDCLQCMIKTNNHLLSMIKTKDYLLSPIKTNNHQLCMIKTKHMNIQTYNYYLSIISYKNSYAF